MGSQRDGISHHYTDLKGYNLKVRINNDNVFGKVCVESNGLNDPGETGKPQLQEVNLVC